MRTVRASIPVVLLSAAFFSGVATAQAPRPADTPMSSPDTLRGHKAISVDIVGVYRGESKHIPESYFRSQLEGALRSAGIKVLSRGSYPMLRLWVLNNCCLVYTVGDLTRGLTSRLRHDVYAINLHFVQLLALPDNKRTIEAVTWRRTHWGWDSKPTHQALGSAADSALSTFLQHYRSVNR